MKQPQAARAGAISLLRYRYTPTFGIIDNPRSPLLDPSHILHAPLTARQATRPKIGLWWSITANTMPGKSVVRHWAQRRLKTAVVKALERMGWDRNGQAKADLGADLGMGKRTRDLEGTLQVHVLPKILQATGEEVQREAETLIGIVGNKVEIVRKQNAILDGKKKTEEACIARKTR